MDLKMDVIYKGNSPPASWSHDDEPVETDVSAEALAQHFETGRGLNSNYNIIVRGIGYWYPPPQTSTSPQVITKRQFVNLAIQALGGNGEGTQALGAIMRAMSTSQDDEVFVVARVINEEQSFDKPQMSALLAKLVNKSTVEAPIMTTEQRAAVLAAWPNG